MNVCCDCLFRTNVELSYGKVKDERVRKVGFELHEKIFELSGYYTTP